MVRTSATVDVDVAGWRTFRSTVGTMLAKMGEHRRTVQYDLSYSSRWVRMGSSGKAGAQMAGAGEIGQPA